MSAKVLGGLCSNSASVLACSPSLCPGVCSWSGHAQGRLCSNPALPAAWSPSCHLWKLSGVQPCMAGLKGLLSAAYWRLTSHSRCLLCDKCVCAVAACRLLVPGHQFQVTTACLGCSRPPISSRLNPSRVSGAACSCHALTCLPSQVQAHIKNPLRAVCGYHGSATSVPRPVLVCLLSLVLALEKAQWQAARLYTTTSRQCHVWCRHWRSTTSRRTLQPSSRRSLTASITPRGTASWGVTLVRPCPASAAQLPGRRPQLGSAVQSSYAAAVAYIQVCRNLTWLHHLSGPIAGIHMHML